MSRKKLGIILTGVFLVVILVVFLLWNTFAVYWMPKAVLTAALSETFSRLEERFGYSAVSAFSGSLNTEGAYTAEMELSAGSTAFDMNVQIDTANGRVQADGRAASADGDLDLSVYLDSDFMAFSSRDLLKGTYYGITFDTFSDDIRSFPLLNLFVTDQTLSQWQESLEGYRSLVSGQKNIPAIQEISEEDLHTLLKTAMALKCDVEKTALLLNGETVSCHQISFRIAGDDVNALLRCLADTEVDPDAQFRLSFYLYQGTVVEVQLQGTSGESDLMCVLSLPPETFGTLQLRCAITENGEDRAFSIRQCLEQGRDCVLEEWSYDDHFNFSDAAVTVAYQWDTENGEMILEGASPVTVYLQETGQGLRLETNDFSGLLGILSEDGEKSSMAFDSCTMLIEKGCDIDTPSYKNLDQWGFEDLVALLGSVGTLFGLQIG